MADQDLERQRRSLRRVLEHLDDSQGSNRAEQLDMLLSEQFMAGFQLAARVEAGHRRKSIDKMLQAVTYLDGKDAGDGMIRYAVYPEGGE